MASIILDSVPDELMKRLELAAKSRHHTLAVEVIDRLDDSFGSKRVAERRSHDELLALARGIRGEEAAEWLTPEFLQMAREYGRE